jgi:hypothetical protein
MKNKSRESCNCVYSLKSQAACKQTFSPATAELQNTFISVSTAAGTTESTLLAQFTKSFPNASCSTSSTVASNPNDGEKVVPKACDAGANALWQKTGA